jgi:hypothetical protein
LLAQVSPPLDVTGLDLSYSLLDGLAAGSDQGDIVPIVENRPAIYPINLH